MAVMADIQQMFHSFVVAKEHWNFLRFLWYDNNDLNNEVLEYQMRVHVFGKIKIKIIFLFVTYTIT